MQIKIKNNHFDLLLQKAVFWQEKKTLLIGDLHLGKIAHFRSEGIAIPQAAASNNFKRLEELVETKNPERIIFLGDLFHSKYNSEWETFSDWRKKYHHIGMVIVLGNHDVLPVSLFLENNLEVFKNDFEEEGFVFTHHPKVEPDPDRFVFAGHIHPVFTTHGKGRQRFRLPCFVVDQYQAILPSFGVFTGGFGVDLAAGRSIYMLTEEKVFALKG